MASLQIGKPAPDFKLQAAEGKTVKLSDYRGQYVVLYFYPKDMTPACTTEACDFRDHYEEFAGLDAVVIGISTDTVKRHQRFAEKYQLPFQLLSDEEHKAAELYGVWQPKKMFGKEFMGIVRSTFIIGKRGELLKEWRRVKVKDHVRDALEYIRALQSHS